jgi:ubiquinone/menaquinone biosynthesis C-methylase UbiE
MERPMVATDKLFAGSIPEIYDRFLVPLIFEPYAVDLADRVAKSQPRDVLETAAGTGVLTRALASRLAPSVRIVATDLNQPMLDQASRRQAEGAPQWKQADALALPFADQSFDAVACQFGVMFFPDKARAYREVHRVLVRGGTYHFNVWDSFTFNPFARITQDTVARFFREDAPIFYAVPFGYHRIDDIKASLLEAGFEDIAVHVLKIDRSIPSSRQFAEGLILGNPIVEEIRTRGVDPEPIVTAVMTALQAAFGPDPGCMPLQAIVFRARKREGRVWGPLAAVPAL